MFFALRGMAYLPVESMNWGGLGWFSDLTVADPYYVLPLLTSATLYLQLHFATEGASLEQAGPILRGFMKVMPAFLFPITMSFPAVCSKPNIFLSTFRSNKSKLLKVRIKLDSRTQHLDYI